MATGQIAEFKFLASCMQVTSNDENIVFFLCHPKYVFYWESMARAVCLCVLVVARQPIGGCEAQCKCQMKEWWSWEEDSGVHCRGTRSANWAASCRLWDVKVLRNDGPSARGCFGITGTHFTGSLSAGTVTSGDVWSQNHHSLGQLGNSSKTSPPEDVREKKADLGGDKCKIFLPGYFLGQVSTQQAGLEVTVSRLSLSTWASCPHLLTSRVWAITFTSKCKTFS